MTASTAAVTSNVYIYNATQQGLTIYINNGTTPLTTSGATAAQLWAPVVTSPAPVFNGTTTPSAGQFSYGTNTVSVYSTSGGPSTLQNFNVDIDKSWPFVSISILIFWSNAGTLSYVALNGGQPFNGALNLGGNVSLA
ncbi:hypothetical protein DBR42_25045 [Pelomonas sp. HMWF004]|nr:hypothetical protein DBR42_25045 [Pelomonas sp. HMWF004]